MLFLRLQDREEVYPPMQLGICLSANDFFAKIAYHIQVPAASVLQIAIRLPVDICELDEYVLQIEAGNQSKFENLTNIISNAVGGLGSGTIPARYILTATIAVE